MTTDYTKQFSKAIVADLKPQLTNEIEQRNKAKAAFNSAVDKLEDLKNTVQRLTNEHHGLEATADTKKDIERLKKLNADIGVYTQLAAKGEGRLAEAKAALKQAQDSLDARIKNLMPKFHAGQQREADVYIEDLLNRLNGYNQAVRRFLDLDIHVGFPTRNKPWATLQVFE